jgi:hypothetical protein
MNGTSVTNVGPQRAPQVRTDALARWLGAPRPSGRRGDHEVRHEPADRCQLVGVAVGEVLRAEKLGLGGDLSDTVRTRRALGTGDRDGGVDG